MNESIEYQYIVTQLNANELIRSSVQKDITTLLSLVQSKRSLLKYLDDYDSNLNSRINAISGENKLIVKYDV